MQQCATIVKKKENIIITYSIFCYNIQGAWATWKHSFCLSRTNRTMQNPKRGWIITDWWTNNRTLKWTCWTIRRYIHRLFVWIRNSTLHWAKREDMWDLQGDGAHFMRWFDTTLRSFKKLSIAINLFVQKKTFQIEHLLHLKQNIFELNNNL